MTAVNTFLQVDLADVDSFTREFLEEVLAQTRRH